MRLNGLNYLKPTFPTFFLAVCLLIGCSQPIHVLSKYGEAIQFLDNPEDYPQCMYVGHIRTMTATGPENSYEQAMIKIRNRSSRKEGTHLKIISAETDSLATTIQGEVYRCPLTAEKMIKPNVVLPPLAPNTNKSNEGQYE